MILADREQALAEANRIRAALRRLLWAETRPCSDCEYDNAVCDDGAGCPLFRAALAEAREVLG
jgi:hypothetical protein